MATRTAKAEWRGTLQEGNGEMALGSGAWRGPFTFKTRFEGEGGANPEELIGAALAGCFSMQLGHALAEAGTTADSISTEARVHLRAGDAGPSITRIDLVTRGRVTGLGEEAFREAAETAKSGCIVSRALAGVNEITLDATLEN
jgi:osmotically inducible protein OsmC